MINAGTIGLFSYLGAGVVTFLSLCARGAYNDDDMNDIEYMFPLFGKAIIWPLTWLYGFGVVVGTHLKEKKVQAEIKAEEEKKLLKEHKKLLKEAGFDG